MPTMQRCKEIAENYERKAMDAERRADALDEDGHHKQADALRYGADVMRQRALNWRKQAAIQGGMMWASRGTQ